MREFFRNHGYACAIGGCIGAGLFSGNIILLIIGGICGYFHLTDVFNGDA